MPDAPDRRDRIVDIARELLESGGPAALSMRRIAERMGVTAPALYRHVPDKAALEHALISRGFVEWADAFAQAARDGGDPLHAFARSYRRYALAHPHLYRLMTTRPLDRARLDPGAEERAAAPLVAAVGGDPDLARAAWAFAHGMAILELDGRFPEHADLDAAWARGIAALARRD